MEKKEHINLFLAFIINDIAISPIPLLSKLPDCLSKKY